MCSIYFFVLKECSVELHNKFESSRWPTSFPMIFHDWCNFRGDFSCNIYKVFFSRSLCSRVSFNLQSAQRFNDFWHLYIQTLRLGQTEMSALLRTDLKNIEISCKSKLLKLSHGYNYRDRKNSFRRLKNPQYKTPQKLSLFSQIKSPL